MMRQLFQPADRPEKPVSRHRRRHGPFAGLLAGGLAFVAAFEPAPAAQALGEPAVDRVALATTAPSEPTHHPREKTFVKRQWGVEVLYVRQTAAGYMLEFRYKVLDADKAKPLFDRQTKPVLTHTRTGAALVVPAPAKTGALRNSNSPHAGTTYWMFFANPGRLVQPGDKVNIAIGKFHADGLVVR